MKIPGSLFKNHRFPAEIIQYAVWLYFVFPLSFRDVELLLHQRGIMLSHESILYGAKTRPGSRWVA
jgi:transposase-like protein